MSLCVLSTEHSRTKSILYGCDMLSGCLLLINYCEGKPLVIFFDIFELSTSFPHTHNKTTKAVYTSGMNADPETSKPLENAGGTGVDRADPDVFDEDHGRRNARAFTWDLDPAGRRRAAEKLLAWLNKGRENPDGTFTPLGPRTWAVLFGKLAEINSQNMKDQHHLEGQKVNLTATISKAPDVEAAELVAELRRGDLTPRAN